VANQVARKLLGGRRVEVHDGLFAQPHAIQSPQFVANAANERGHHAVAVGLWIEHDRKFEVKIEVARRPLAQNLVIAAVARRQH
jgi:hypothetical protein